MLLLALVACASAEMIWLPDATLNVTPEASVVTLGAEQAVYVSGLGWLGVFSGPPPQQLGAEVWVPLVVAQALVGSTLLETRGVITSVRIAGREEVRVVLDMAGLAPEDLRPLATIGSVAAGERLQLALPARLSDPSPATVVGLFELQWRTSPVGTTLLVSGGAFGYHLFALADPSRLVLDLRPATSPGLGFAEQVQQLAPGVVYRTYRAPANHGSSRVHVLEVAPSEGVWTVRAVAGESRATLAWAQPGLVAINGGYFDAGSRSSIGLLVINGEWLSPPSRGRAVVAFGPQGVVIDRVQSRTAVVVDARTVVSLSDPLAGSIGVYRQPGVLAGSTSVGVLVLNADMILLANRVGPAEVPADGVVVVYPANLRALALVEPGSRVHTHTRLTPAGLEGALFAVEAGPLLVKNGLADFAPEQEAFARGVRILDEVTQQAAIGIRADGTVLLVAAETMVAADLVPLMLALGAEDAMRLDSGGSATLVADGRVLNRTRERAVVNAIVYQPAGGR